MPAHVPRTAPSKRADRLVEAVEPREPHDRGGLAAGDDETVEAVELLRQAHLDDVGAETRQDGGVLPKGTLEREHADPWRPLRHGESVDAASRRSNGRRPLTLGMCSGVTPVPLRALPAADFEPLGVGERGGRRCRPSARRAPRRRSARIFASA